MATIREIAQKAGYSPATVSRLLNKDPLFSISDSAREKIIKVAEKLNYFDNHAAVGNTYKMAIIFSVAPQKELQDIYYVNLRNSLASAGKKSDMIINFCHDIEEVPTDTDGFIAVGYFSPAQIVALRDSQLTGIFLDSNPDPESFNSVQPNLESITQRAIDLFRQAHFDQIGFVGGKFWDSESQNTLIDDSRKKYFESHMRELGIFDNRFVFIGKSFSVESGYQLGKEIVHSLKDQPLPQGFFIASDPLAVGVLQAFNENKITVPVDTSIISIDDIELAKYVSPPLTTFRIDMDELGRLAIEMLRDSIMFPNHGKRIISLNSELIYRKSFLKPVR